MSTATVAGDAPVAPKSGKKKLIIIVVAVVVLLAAAGGGALFFLKKKAHADDEASAEDESPAAVAKVDPKVPPVFVPLEPFTVNLADKEAERYAQIGVTFAVADSKVVDSIKVFMPAIRNNILMVLAHKTSAELLLRDGKDQLAAEILRETSRALGYEVADPKDEVADDDKPKKKRKKQDAEPLPIKSVYFSNFIVQ
jgi:flagellar FliL protein